MLSFISVKPSIFKILCNSIWTVLQNNEGKTGRVKARRGGDSSGILTCEKFVANAMNW